MSTPLDIQETTLIAIIVLMMFGSAFVAAILYAVDRAHCSIRETKRLHWLVLLALIAIGSLMFTGAKPDPYIAPLDRALITEPPQPAVNLIVNLADCPPRADGMTDQLIMTIETRSDLAPLVTGCSRIAERQYLTKGN